MVLLMELYDFSLVFDIEVKVYVDQVCEIIVNGLENCEEFYCECWCIIEEYVLVCLEYFEIVKGFYDCEYYFNKYYFIFEVNSDSCDLVCEIFSRLNWGGCVEGDFVYDVVKVKFDGNDCCIQFVGLVGVGIICLQEGDYDCVFENLLFVVQEEDEVICKLELLLLVFKVYYVYKCSYISV